MSTFKLAFSVLLCGAVGVLCIPWIVVNFGRREYLTALVVLSFAVTCFALVMPLLVKIVPGTARPEGVYDTGGTTIRPDRFIDLSGRISLIGGVVGMGLFAVFGPLGKLDIPIPRTMRYYLPFVGAIGALTGLPVLWRNFKRGGAKFLRLTPDGFEISEGSSSPRGKWDNVEDVTDRVPGETAMEYSAIVMVMSDGQTPTLSADSFTPKGQALRELVRFYWQHPEHRGELTNGRALERLHGQEFEAEQ